MSSSDFTADSLNVKEKVPLTDGSIASVDIRKFINFTIYIRVSGLLHKIWPSFFSQNDSKKHYKKWSNKIGDSNFNAGKKCMKIVRFYRIFAPNANRALRGHPNFY